MTDIFLKDPGDRVDYQIDYTDWLDGDTISASAWTLPDGITQYSASVNGANTIVTIWLTGGTHGVEYIITNQITTAGGRIKQKSFKVLVRNDVA